LAGRIVVGAVVAADPVRPSLLPGGRPAPLNQAISLLLLLLLLLLLSCLPPRRGGLLAGALS